MAEVLDSRSSVASQSSELRFLHPRHSQKWTNGVRIHSVEASALLSLDCNQETKANYLIPRQIDLLKTPSLPEVIKELNERTNPSQENLETKVDISCLIRMSSGMKIQSHHT
jgi:hypothetical protein